MYKNIFNCFVLMIAFLMSDGLMAQQTEYGCELIVPRDELVESETKFWFYQKNFPTTASPPAGGFVCRYHESGKLAAETPYLNHNRQGQMKVYRENGKLFATIDYKDSSPISGLCHRINGTTTPLTNAELINWKNRVPIECD